jgi:hypothetical protein
MRPPRLALLALALASLASPANEPVVVGKQEILYLDQLATPSRWQPAEATVTQAKVQTPGQRPALLFHIPVDHHAGEAKYPIGWPRMYCPLRRPAETDWASWDRLEFDIHTTMSEGELPKNPLTFQILCPDRHQNNTSNLTEMKLGEWVTISIPISTLKHLPELNRLGFNISESNYKDKTQLDFRIGGFRLIRSAECALASLVIKSPVVYRDAKVLKVELDVVGPPANVSRGIPFEIRQGDTVLRHETLPAQRGKRVVEMEIGELKLQPGDYRLVAFPGDADRQRQGAFKVVPSPWEDKK